MAGIEQQPRASAKLTMLQFLGVAVFASMLGGCTVVGPDYVPPDTEVPDTWTQVLDQGLSTAPVERVEWWRVFDDPVLNELVANARQNNNTLEIAGLRVLEARAQLGIAQGLQFPQAQAASGEASYVSPPENTGIDAGYWQLGLGAGISWEIDFWGRFKRGIEAADAAYLASIAGFDQAQVLLASAVVGTYTTIRSLEEQLAIARQNVAIQQRSYDITEVLYRNGSDSELDMQQALTLLLSTQATIPALETTLVRARNALSVLLGEAPGRLVTQLERGGGLPDVPADIAIGLPADLLRQRPDVRQAEYLAMAQNAAVGLAAADLYPSFSLTGSIGVASNTLGDADFGDLFSSDALTWSVGPSFIWPFLNYGRIKNNVRVQDARLQQALVNYRETVLQSAREAEDAMATFIGARQQHEILEKTVSSAIRSNELATLRYREGFSDYERVLNSQQALFAQQQRYITNQGDIVLALVQLFTALGGGWETREGIPELDPKTLELMRERTDWGDLIPAGAN
ncbi:MAG: efflux transporter outer membrane subunit [Xanthomonadales bacterium]|nr:efflux transporter outer membrane subunit [Xanthomonadales bacterium]